MNEPTDEDRFDFTWGVPWLDDIGYVRIYGYMLAAYSKMGITRQEMLCLIHLAAYHYNSPKGKSCPTLKTIAHEMGYQNRETVSRLVLSLEGKGLLRVTRRPGYSSIYNARPFTLAAMRYYLDDLDDQSFSETWNVFLTSKPPTKGGGD